MANIMISLEKFSKIENFTAHLSNVQSQSNLSNNILEATSDPFEFTLKNVFLVLFLLCLGVVTIFGNIIVLLAIFVDFRLRQPTHYLLGSLALADLLLGKLINTV